MDAVLGVYQDRVTSDYRAVIFLWEVGLSSRAGVICNLCF